MAYRADIEIAVKGAQELKRLQNEIRTAADAVNSLNSSLSGVANLIPRSFDNLNKTVADAAKSFNAAALGTDEATAAARKYVQATDELNAGLRERIALLAKVRAEQRITRPGDAGTGQQTPALPPTLIRTYEIGQNWIKFFQDAAGVAVDLRARSLNTKASWNDFFATAAQAAVNVKANSLNTKASWNDFFKTAAQAAVNVKANSLNTKASWNDFFKTAAQAAVNVKANSLNTKARWQEFFQEAQELAVELKLQAQRTSADIRRSEGAASAAARQRLADAAASRQGAGPAVGGGGGGSRAGGAISSALIGGGFPLLFGQGPAAAAGGALGGVAGGLLGGGFGFALSIVGTALGDAVTKAEAFNKSLSTLNAGLSATGRTSITTASDVGKLASSLNVTKDEAIELLNTFKQFRDGDTREALAALFAPVGGASTFEAIAKAGIDEKNALSAIFSLRKEIGNDAAIQLALQLKSVGATATQSKLLEIVLDRSIEISVAQASQVNFTDRLLSIWEGIIAGLAQALSLATRFIAKMQEGSFIKLPFLDKIAAVLGGVTGRTPEEIAGQRGDDLTKELNDIRKKVRAALAAETGAVNLENTLGESYKTGAKPPEDRTQQLQADFEAIYQTAAAENQIRDLLFEGKEIRAAETELAKALYDIDRDRTKALLGANYESEKALINKIAQTREIDAQLRMEDKIRDIKQRDFEKELAVQDAVRDSIKVFTDIRKQRDADLQYSKTYSRLLMEGILPAEAERLANFERLVRDQLSVVDTQITITEAAILEAKARELSVTKLQEELDLLKKKRDAIAGEAAVGPGAGPTNRERLQDEIDAVQGQFNALIDPINLLTQAAQGIGDAFANSFKGIISGSMSAKEALAGFFQSVADAFLDMAAQIIAKWIQMTILNSILRLFPGGSMGGGGGLASGFSAGTASAIPTDAGGWAQSFATVLPGRASGGPVSGGQMYMVGERGPELFVPGRSGTIVPNEKMAGGGDVNVVVNVDAKGTSVEGDENEGKQLGRLISAAVQSELIKQQRPGGLLAR